MPAPPPVVVFLEGVSDVAAVRALLDTRRAGTRATPGTPPKLVDLGGVTNIRRALTATRRQHPDATVLGLCDAAEARFVERAIAGELGVHVRDATDLPAYGFFVCHKDLEDELIRALGTDRTIGVIDRLGLGGKLISLQRQPAWQDRPLHEQLHRFCGVASGRKELLARELAAALSPDAFPEPLRQLVDRITA